MNRVSSRIEVRVTPRAACTEIAGWSDGVLRVRVTAPPVKSRANHAVERLIANALGVAPSRVSVVSGASSRTKLVLVEGMALEEIGRRLDARFSSPARSRAGSRRGSGSPPSA
jgi:uncharacterized protein YggU (UPF0235/DUF167 family)